MSRRYWNSVLERRFIEDATDTILELYQTASMLCDSSSDSESGSEESDSEMSTSSSSESSITSISSEDSASDASSSSEPDILEDILLLAEEVNHLADRIYAPIHSNVNFGSKMMKRIADIDSDDESIAQFRFRKDHLQDFADQLWPRIKIHLEGEKDRLILANRYRAPYETCLLIFLFRLSRPRRIQHDMEKFFEMRLTHISSAIHTFSTALCKVAVQYLLNPLIWIPRMQYYAEKIESKCGGLFNNIWGFIDATIRPTCKPIRYQRACYTRYKKCHGIKFQSVVVPDGFVACLFGPVVARRHDARLFHTSGLLALLQIGMPDAEYALYGDLAYPQSDYLLKGFRNAQPGTPQATFNARMSACRIAVEWGFAGILSQWPYCDFSRSMQIFKEPVGQYFINATFLTNARQTFYGNQTSEYFQAPPLTLQQYLELTDNN